MLAHKVDGDGPALVLLNGGLMSIASWDAMVAAIGGAFRIIRCDFRGQLLSPGPPFPASLDEHARDVLDLLDFLGIDRAHVFGTSFGSEVAMAIAATATQRVRTLTVANAVDRSTPAMSNGARRLQALAEAAAAGGDGGELFRAMVPTTFSPGWLQKQPADFVETRAGQVASFPPQFFSGAAAILSVVATFDMTPYFDSIAAPALVIAADHDALFPVPHSIVIANAIRGARLEIVHDCGHAAVVEQGPRVATLVRDFIDAHESVATR